MGNIPNHVSQSYPHWDKIKLNMLEFNNFNNKTVH